MEAAAMAGVAYAALSIIGFVLLHRFPDLSLGDEELAAWFEQSKNQTSLILGANLVSVSTIAFLWFVAVIRRRIGDREDRFFATVMFGSAIASVGIWLAAAVALASPAIAVTALDTRLVSSLRDAAGALRG